MDNAVWAFVIALMTLGYLSLYAARLVRAVWSARPLQPARATLVFVTALIGTAALSLPHGRSEALVAGVSSASPVPTNVEAVAVSVSGSRVRIAGTERREPPDRVWAVVEDPRTENLWVQGPAAATEGGWALDVVIGIDPMPPKPLLYRVNVLAVDEPLGVAWLTAANDRRVVSPDSLPTNQTWLLRDRAVLAGL
ncbi:MAG TPA: hypothetical protein VFC51_17905 [Chloroflexota bacterium]|nr:hypothetical protein [Chloroflexota bacterium]